MEQELKVMKLYKNTVTIEFDEKKHAYYLNGSRERLLSVTTVTGIIDKSRPLIIWATRLARDHMIANVKSFSSLTEDDAIRLIEDACNRYKAVKEEAATKGSAVHDWVEKFVDGEKPEMPTDEQILNGVTAFLRWYKEHDVAIVKSESIVYSKKYKYVGKLDAIAKIKGKLCLVDFKTSNGLYNEYRYQVSAYRAAYEEEAGKKLGGSNWLIRFDKGTGDFFTHELEDQAEDFKAFLGALAIKQRERELSKNSKYGEI